MSEKTQIPTEDGIDMQDIRLIAGEGKLSEKTIQQTLAVIRKQRCKEHPDAPHGFNRNASHSLGRYVCDCEGWEQDD